MFLTLPSNFPIKFDFASPIPSSGNTSSQTNTVINTTNIPNSSSNISGNEQETLLRLLHAEAGGEGILGMALVARSVLNRQELINSGKIKAGEFNAKSGSLTDIISAPSQYQPYGEGKLNNELSASNKEKAMQALNLALNPEELKKQLQAAGKSTTEINKLMASTGFRAGSAFNDPSQNVNNVVLGNHTFNTAGNAQLMTFA